MPTLRVFDKKIFCLILFFCCLGRPARASIQEVEQFSQIERTLDALEEGAWVVLDVDDVMMTDEDAILRPVGDPLKFQIFHEYYCEAQSKKEKEQVAQILSLPLIQAQKKLVEKKLPEIITCLQKKNIKVIALTSCPTQPTCYISNFEEKRLNFIRQFGIDLKKSFPHLNRFTFDDFSQKNIPLPIYHDGVIFTEGFSKADVLASFIKMQKKRPKSVVFIDDMTRNVQQMEMKLFEMKIDHLGFCYKKVEKESKLALDERVARFQFKYLFKHKKWISDKEVKKMIRP